MMLCVSRNGTFSGTSKVRPCEPIISRQASHVQVPSAYFVEEAVEVDLDRLAGRRVEQDVLAVPVAQPADGRISVRGRVLDKGAHAPEDEANHRDDGGGARVGETSAVPGGRFGEGLEEPVVEDGWEPAHKVSGMRGGKEHERCSHAQDFLVEPLAGPPRVVTDGVEDPLQVGALRRETLSAESRKSAASRRSVPMKRFRETSTPC